MRSPSSGRLLLPAALLIALSVAPAARAQPAPAPTAAESAGVKAAPALPPGVAAVPMPECAPCANKAIDAPKDDLEETPILVPSGVPTGFLVAWKPSINSVGVDSGAGPTFGSKKFQPLRALARYTHHFSEGSPFVGRLELEGGRFQTDAQPESLGSNGADLTFRVVGGAATRVSPRWNILSSIGAITRYQWGKPTGGAPTIGVFGVVANSELEYKVAPSITLILFGEVALTPFPYLAQSELGDLSDGSELKARVQLAFDLTPQFAVDVGVELTRWHSAFSNSTIVANNPDHALLIETREAQITLGVRWKNR